MSENSGLTSDNYKLFCLRIAQTQSRSPSARGKNLTSLPPAGPRREETLSNLGTLCPHLARPGPVCRPPEGVCLPQRHPESPGQWEGAVPARPESGFCPVPAAAPAGRTQREQSPCGLGSARPGCPALMARCRAPGWNGLEIGAVWGQGTRQCRS